MRFLKGLPGLLTVLLLSFALLVQSQGLYKISADEKISSSSLIVEGRVVGKQSFWNNQRTMIYTSNRIEVYKIFKGTLQKDEIEVVTTGGAVGNYYIHASHLLELNTHDVGVFFCDQNGLAPTGVRTTDRAVYNVFSSSQGFLKYDLVARTASAPFASYADIERSLYTELATKTGRKAEIIRSGFDIKKLSEKLRHADNSILAPTVASFSPAIVNSGALLDLDNNVLTIRGSGFGAASGDAAILFPHADFAPGTNYTVPYDNQLVISWSDTEIKVHVPTQAATGSFRVRDNAGATTTSPSALQVRYSVLTADFGSPYGIKQFNLGNANGNGGYNIKYSTSTANGGMNINASAAKGTFQRALNTWKETTGLNFHEDGTSNIQTIDADDGQNMVMFDNGGTGLAPLASGVLATCFSGITICTNNPQQNQAQKTGFDILIRNTGFSSGSTPFTFGPCPPYSSSTSQVDLETVLLHELGHALNLGHINDSHQGSGAGTATPAKVMHFAISFNLRRISLDYSAKAGALYQITPHGYTFGNCVATSPEMAPLPIVAETKDDCPASFPTTVTAMNSTVSFDLIHATSNKEVDPGYTQMSLDGSGANITNTAYYVVRTNSMGGGLNIRVANYTSSPATVAECTPGSSGIAVTGIKAALYKVANCPDGGEFPVPDAVFTFKQDGNLPVINALSPSSNYLLVLDGIQNTKAAFDLQFSGTALIVRSTELAGSIVDEANRLTWTTDVTTNITHMVLERSPDGSTFTELTEIVGSDRQESGEYLDQMPLVGNNYYRLAVENPDGTIDYSEVVLLTRQDEEVKQLNVYPNPVTGNAITVQIRNKEPGRYQMSFVGGTGEVVYRRLITVATNNHKETIPTNVIRRGIYILHITGPDNQSFQSVKVVIP